MMPFFNQTGLERVGTVGSEAGLLLGWSASSNVALLCKNKKGKGSAGGSPVTAPMRKSVLQLMRKDRLLRGRMFFAYLSPMG